MRTLAEAAPLGPVRKRIDMKPELRWIHIVLDTDRSLRKQSKSKSGSGRRPMRKAELLTWEALVFWPLARYGK